MRNFLLAVGEGRHRIIGKLGQEDPVSNYWKEEAPFYSFIRSKTLLAVGWIYFIGVGCGLKKPDAIMLISRNGQTIE